MTISLCRPSSPSRALRIRPSNSELRTTSISGRPSLLYESRFRISEKRAIAKNKPFLSINHGDAFHHASQDRARAIAFATQRADLGLSTPRRFVERRGQLRKLIA